MSTLFDLGDRPSLAIVGEESRFPINRVFCVGRNYAEHAREMGHDPDREAPFFFMKPADAILEQGNDFPYPDLTSNLHHEIEYVVALGKGGKNIAQADALDHIYGYAVGLDMTRRDLQGEMKKAGRPWECGKAFDASGPCGAITPASQAGHPTDAAIWLKVNGQDRQASNINQLTWSVPEIIEHLSALFTLKAGDLIFTGTPEGVAAVSKGDQLLGGIDGLGEISFNVV
ncbi:fumarylacetoacetate hydrolase family protein [Rhodovibrionaceae bacterium A322]